MSFPSFVFHQLFVRLAQLSPEIRLKDQNVPITGSNTGIGLGAARQCVKVDANNLIFAVRSIFKGKAAKADILKSNSASKTRVEVWNLSQGFIKSVNAFGKRIQGLPHLGVAILNAAIFKFLPILGKTSRELKQPTRLAATSSEVALWTPFKEQKPERILDCLNDQKYFGSDHLDRCSVRRLE
jgi:NAD(P)-dependent dehydrogenase (short-subunit alcohol dehydrogenase family)